ncbi:MAG: hypothetical protein QJR08_11060, partial [Bacillota bacterium]|nr:hypothetical protein [Bacillota bacterium]
MSRKAWTAAGAAALALALAAGGWTLAAAIGAANDRAALQAELTREAARAARDLAPLVRAGAVVEARATDCQDGAAAPATPIPLRADESLTAQAILQAQRPGCSGVDASVGRWTAEIDPVKATPVMQRDVPRGRAEVRADAAVQGSKKGARVTVTVAAQAPERTALFGLVRFGGGAVRASGSAAGSISDTDVSLIMEKVATEAGVAQMVMAGQYVPDPGAGGKMVGTPKAPPTPPAWKPEDQSKVVNGTGYVQPPV